MAINVNTGRYEPKVVQFEINNNGCWVCTSHGKRGGYPQKYYHGKSHNISRLVYEAFCGDIPNGFCVLHKCDNPACINPYHLFMGTRADNNKDRDIKSRHVRMCGERHGNARFTFEQIKSIRDDKRKQTEIAKAYNASQAVISQIKRKVTWKCVA